jgi:stress response protein SCP2
MEAATKEATAALTRGLGWTQRKEKAAAALQAQDVARRYFADEQARLGVWRDETQRGADEWWAALLAGQEDLVCACLNDAFSDNPAGGLAVGFEGGVASVVIRQPDFDELPESRPDLTPGGKPTLKKMLVKERRRLFLDSLVSNVAATLREALAVAPSVQQVTVLVLSRSARSQALGPVLLGSWTRVEVERVPWGTPDDALRLITDRSVELHFEVTAGREVKQLSSSRVPGLASLLLEADDEDEEPARTPAVTSPAAPRSMEQWWRDSQQPASLPAEVTRQLESGQVAVLTGPVVVTVELTSPEGEQEVDLSVLLLDDASRVRQDSDFVFYNAPVSPQGAVRIHPVYAHGRGSTRRVVVDLSRLSLEGVGRCAVIISGERGVAGAPLLVRDDHAEPWAAPSPREPGLTASVAVELYRRIRPEGDEWRLRGVGQGWSDGLAGLVRSYGVVVE